MKNLLRILTVLIIILSATSYSQYPVVQSIINQVNIDSLIFFVEELSGEVQTTIGGSPYTILSRYYTQTGNDKAADYIQQKLESYGLTVFNQQYSSLGRNVYAIQTGTEFPNQSYIICAHYDDMPSGPIAPGADDNASGTAAVIETARIFSQYSFPYTIIYALWDEEEQGLNGSNYYSTQAATSGDSILGVINLDMIAWDSNSDYSADLHIRAVGTSLYLKDKIVGVNTIYNLGLNIDIKNPGSTASDHSSFWTNNFGAIWLYEDESDLNLHYHTVNDLVTHFNQPYYSKMCKIAVGTFATLALNLDIKIMHTSIATRDNINDIETTARIITGLDIGTGQNTPRLWYRINQGSGWSDFYDVVGVPLMSSLTYQFTIPGQSLGTFVQYYLAAQDEDSTIVTTLPAGGGGFTPPGNIPPNEFFEFYVAFSNIAFSDSAINLNNWTSVGGWDVTSEKFTSSPYSFTDSPGGNYPSNSNATLTQNGSISLDGYFGAILEFQTQWDIEDNWDYAQLLISTNNGTIWIPLEGQYTNPGVGPIQPGGEPLYDGTQSTWVKESIDLNEYLDEEINLRFLLISDGSYNKDGFYVDDINLIVLEPPTDVKSVATKITNHSLFQNYPNPFNSNTTIKYLIPKLSYVTLKVYDVLGNEIATLVNEEKTVGNYQVDFDASSLSSGIYFYKLQADSFVETKKMILLE